MEATRNLITNPLEIPADAWAHGDIQSAAEIPFDVLETLAEELGAEKLPVHTLNWIGWFYTKAEQIVATAKQRGLSDWRYTGSDIFEKVDEFRATYA